MNAVAANNQFPPVCVVRFAPTPLLPPKLSDKMATRSNKMSDPTAESAVAHHAHSGLETVDPWAPWRDGLIDPPRERALSVHIVKSGRKMAVNVSYASIVALVSSEKMLSILLTRQARDVLKSQAGYAGELLTDTTIAQVEEAFRSRGFYRVNRSHLLALARMSHLAIDDRSATYIVMHDVPEPILVARRRVQELKKILRTAGMPDEPQERLPAP